MSYNGSGTFAINSTGQPVVAGTVISSTVFNSLTADLGTGLSTAITKDGQTTTTARILFAAGISSTLATDATSISTGSILTLGGLGVTKAAWIGGLMNVAGAATFQSTIGITGALNATTINASGLVAMAAAATVGTTLAVTGTSTMAAINASGTFTGAAGSFTTLSASGLTQLTTGGTGSSVLSLANNDQSNLRLKFVNSGSGGQTWSLVGGAPGASNAGLAIYNETGAATIAQFSSTGLAVTGTLSISSDVTITSASAYKIVTGGYTHSISQSGDTLFVNGNGTSVGSAGDVRVTARAVTIGTFSSTGLSVTGTLGVTGNVSSAGTQGFIWTGNQAGAWPTVASGGAVTWNHSNGSAEVNFWNTTTTPTTSFNWIQQTGASSGTTLMTLDASGNLLVGGTTAGAKIRIETSLVSQDGLDIKNTSATTGQTFVAFFNSANVLAGTITQPTSTTVLYNTTSDYRLKTVVGAVTGQGARIDALKPIDYEWTDGGQQARGFLAHEFQAVYSNSVTGTKDAVDADGNPVYQAMQAATSEVIADLVAEIQSLRARLSAANIA